MKYFLYLLSLSFLISCGSAEKSESPEEKNEPNFTVSGEIKGAENTAIYLEALSQEGSITIAKGNVQENGTFKLTEFIPGMGIYQLRLGESQEKIIPLTLVPDDNVAIKTTFANFATEPNVSGTEWCKFMNGYMVHFSNYVNEQMQLNSLKGRISEEEMMARYLKLRQPIDEYAREKMQEDPDNPFNIVLSTSATPTMGFENWNPENLTVLKAVAEAFKKRYKDSPMAMTMENQVIQIETAYNEYQMASGSRSSDAAMAPEIAMKNPSGKIIKLSSLRGKVVLIDFWASWCGPCRKENPNVIRLYNKYKDQGFTIFSVSLDSDPVAWKNAIASDGLVWPNHVCDFMGWKTPMTQLYGFESIPHTVLIDKEGKIIGQGLRGESLEQKLKEVFSKK